MSFKPIRTYLNDRLLETDSTFQVYEQAFTNDFVGENNFDKRFHIAYGPVATTTANQNTTQDVVTATMTLYFSGYRDDAEKLDEAMDIANKFRIACLRQSNLAGEKFIKRVICNSITPEQMPDNDQAFKISLQFNISMIFGLGADLDC